MERIERMIPRLFRSIGYALAMAGLVILSFWMIGFYMPFYWTSAVMEVHVPADKAMRGWSDMRRMAEWSDRFSEVTLIDSVLLVARDSADVEERWSVVRRVSPDSLVVQLDRADYHMVNFFRFERRDSNRTTVRRWVRIYPHGAWFDSWFFFIKSRYVAQIDQDNERFVRIIEGP